MLNSLSVVITEPGEYITRNGNKVIISGIIYPESYNAENTAFPCKGTIYIKRKIRTVKRFNIWHVSGRLYPHKENAFDIVKKV